MLNAVDGIAIHYLYIIQSLVPPLKNGELFTQVYSALVSENALAWMQF